MLNDIIITKENQNHWEQVFQELLDLMDFQLVRYGRDYYGLSDKQGANLGGIEETVFQNAGEILERLDTYTHDYIITDIEEELKDYEINCPTDAQILNGDEPFKVGECEWYWRLLRLLPISDKEHGTEFINKHFMDYNALDLILNHFEEVDLANISAIETDRKIHVVSVSETYVKQFCVLADSNEEALQIVDSEWNNGNLGEMSGNDYLDDSYQIDDVTKELEDYPAEFELVERPEVK